MGATWRKGSHYVLAIAAQNRPAGSGFGHEPGIRSVPQLHSYSHAGAPSVDTDGYADRCTDGHPGADI
jgi:hypothetical protein